MPPTGIEVLVYFLNFNHSPLASRSPMFVSGMSVTHLPIDDDDARPSHTHTHPPLHRTTRGISTASYLWPLPRLRSRDLDLDRPRLRLPPAMLPVPGLILSRLLLLLSLAFPSPERLRTLRRWRLRAALLRVTSRSLSLLSLPLSLLLARGRL
jgi:hypothetical protein